MNSLIEKYPLFSVIIPQKDRAEYLYHTLRTCMIQDYPNFQVIVSDDCSEDNSVEVAQQLSRIDHRIKVFPHKSHIGMRDNFEFALNQVEDGYVMALGGDDGLVAGAIWRMYEILNETGKQLLTWHTTGFVYPEKEGGPNVFYTKRRKKTGVQILKSEDFLNKIARTFRYQIDECPMFYVKGVASMDLVKKVKSRTADGSFYYCPTPDGFSGVVLAGEVFDYAYTEEPLSIMGTTLKSQGANYRRGDKKSKEESLQFFNDNIRRTMHKELASQPYSPLVTLMTADYLLTANDLPGWGGKFQMFKIEDLIKTSFSFLEKSYFEKENLVRELRILREIAKQHNMVELFDQLYNNKKKTAVKPYNVSGIAITNSIRLDGSKVGINNVYDAALATTFIYNSSSLFRLRTLVDIIKNSFAIFVQSKKRKYESFPAID